MRTDEPRRLANVTRAALLVAMRTDEPRRLANERVTPAAQVVATQTD